MRGDTRCDDTPTEYAECVALAQWLDRAGVLYCHVPMGEIRDAKVGAKLRKMGASRGVPDFLIFSPVPLPNGAAQPNLEDKLGKKPDGQGGSLFVEARGIAIEMKRRDGGRCSQEQIKWLGALANAGWLVKVCNGAGEAVVWLKWLGFGGGDDV